MSSNQDSDQSPDMTALIWQHGQAAKKSVKDTFGIEAELHNLYDAPSMENVLSGQKPLNPRDEAIAQSLVKLAKELIPFDYAPELTSEGERKMSLLNAQIRKIGEQLNAEGGFNRMQYIFYRVNTLEPRNSVNYIWDGIGDWHS